MCADKVTHKADVVIVGAGIAGALMAHQFALEKKQVLILEAGPDIPVDWNGYMDRFFNARIKVPESPYPPTMLLGGDPRTPVDPATLNAGRPTSLMLTPDSWNDPKKSYLVQTGKKAFSSTYTRVAGGSALHWLGTSLRFLPTDFKMVTCYGGSDSKLPKGFVDWPLKYEDLSQWYGEAENEIGVSADVSEQSYLGVAFPRGYAYPMPGIPKSQVDQELARQLTGMTFEGQPLLIRSTPAARNTQPYQSRRVCAGNTNCIPICPIQAKYDPTVTLNEALATGFVRVLSRTVASEVVVDARGRVTAVKYRQYKEEQGPETARGMVEGKIFIVAANAIETPRLLLMSKNEGRTPNGVANAKKFVGKYLMDHPYYVVWGRMPQPVWPYRGPLITSGIEGMRDGAFRKRSGAFRVDIGNEGWTFPGGDPYQSALDFVTGRNSSRANAAKEVLFGRALVNRLNDVLTHQFRLGFLIEQSPEESNCVTLSDKLDGLQLPRPAVNYDLSEYTLAGLGKAAKMAQEIFRQLGNQTPLEDQVQGTEPTAVTVDVDGRQKKIAFYGAGHIVGTYRMGKSASDSVVRDDMRSWEHENLYLVGSGVFPTVATANPTLTIAALCLRTARKILKERLV